MCDALSKVDNASRSLHVRFASRARYHIEYPGDFVGVLGPPCSEVIAYPSE
jgi:hypothetical protein